MSLEEAVAPPDQIEPTRPAWVSPMDALKTVLGPQVDVLCERVRQKEASAAWHACLLNPPMRRSSSQDRLLAPGLLLIGTVSEVGMEGASITPISLVDPEAGNSEHNVGHEHRSFVGVCPRREFGVVRVSELTPGTLVQGLVLRLDLASAVAHITFVTSQLPLLARTVPLGPLPTSPPPRPALASRLENSVVFRNPLSGNLLVEHYGLDEHASFLLPLMRTLPSEERRGGLRRQQDALLANDLLQAGVAHQRANRNREALEQYERALTVQPGCVDVLVARGALHTTAGDYEKAVADLTEALRVDPRHPNAAKYLETTLLRRGTNFERIGRLAEASADFTRAADLNGPKHTEVLQSLTSIKKALEMRAVFSQSVHASARAMFGGSSDSRRKDQAAGLNVRDKRTLQSVSSRLETEIRQEKEHIHNHDKKRDYERDHEHYREREHEKEHNGEREYKHKKKHKHSSKSKRSRSRSP